MPSRDFSTTFTVAHDPDTVYRAITEVRAWWSGEIDGATAELGDTFTYRHTDQHESRQRITVAEPGRRIVWMVDDATLSFVANPREWVGTSMVFEIGATAHGGSTVTFTHTGLTPDLECFDACSGAWSYYVGESLKNFLTTRPFAHQEQP